MRRSGAVIPARPRIDVHHAAGVTAISRACPIPSAKIVAQNPPGSFNPLSSFARTAFYCSDAPEADRGCVHATCVRDTKIRTAARPKATIAIPRNRFIIHPPQSQTPVAAYILPLLPVSRRRSPPRLRELAFFILPNPGRPRILTPESHSS